MCKVNDQEQNVDYIFCLSHEADQTNFKPLEVTDTTISYNLEYPKRVYGKRPFFPWHRPKPRINYHPRAKAIYSYQATDTDEISLSENEIVEVYEEGQFEFSCQN